MSKYFICADALFNATNIRQVTAVTHQSNQKHRKSMMSGGAAVSQISAQEQIQVSQITSADLAAIVALNTSTFCSAGLSLLASTITIPKKIRAAGALFVSGSNNVHVTGANALIVPTQFEATQDGDFATAQMDIHWLTTDGGTAGAQDAVSQAIAAQAFSAEYTLGPCYINGTLLAGVQGFVVTPGIEVVKPPLGAGSVSPLWASIKTVQPTMQVTVNDFDAIAGTIGIATAMTSANFYMKKRADSGIFVAGATAEHIRFTFAAGLTDTDSVSVNNNDDGSATITLHGKVLTAAAAVALP